MGACHQLGGFQDILGVDAAFDRAQGVAGFAEHHVPQRRAVLAGLGRRQWRKVEPAYHNALRQLELEIAYAVAADGAAEAGDGRLADIGALGDLRVRGIDREGDVSQHHVGDPPFGGAQLAVGILDLRQDVGDRLGINLADNILVLPTAHLPPSGDWVRLDFYHF